MTVSHYYFKQADDTMGNIAENKNNKMNRIIESAYELFKSKSVNSTTIDDVVKAAGIAKGTFYLYFSDKYDLLDRLIIDKSTDIFTCAFSLSFSDDSVNFYDSFNTFVDNVINSLNEHKELTALIQKNLSKCFMYFANTDDGKVKSMIDYLVKSMGEMGYSRDASLKKLYIITDMIGSVCCDAIVTGIPYSLEEIKPLLHSSVASILRNEGEK